MSIHGQDIGLPDFADTHKRLMASGLSEETARRLVINAMMNRIQVRGVHLPMGPTSYVSIRSSLCGPGFVSDGGRRTRMFKKHARVMRRHKKRAAKRALRHNKHRH